MNKKIMLVLVVCCVAYGDAWAAFPSFRVRTETGVVGVPRIEMDRADVLEGAFWEGAGELHGARLGRVIEVVFSNIPSVSPRPADPTIQLRDYLKGFLGYSWVRAVVDVYSVSMAEMRVLDEVLGDKLYGVRFTREVGFIERGALRLLPENLAELELPSLDPREMADGPWRFNFNVTDEDLIHFQRLERFSMGYVPTTIALDDVLGEWARGDMVRTLRHLDVVTPDVGSRHVAPFTALQTLRLRFSEAPIVVAELPVGLTDLGFVRCHGVEGESFERFPGLTSLEIDLTARRGAEILPFPPELLFSIGRLLRLEKLVLRRLPDPLARQMLLYIPLSVTHLEFTHSPIFPIAAEEAAHFRRLRLEALNVEASNFTNEDFALLPLTLRRLSLRSCYDNLFWVDFSKMRNLEAVDLVGSQLRRDSLFTLPRRRLDVVVSAGYQLYVQDLLDFQRERGRDVTMHFVGREGEGPRFEVFPRD